MKHLFLSFVVSVLSFTSFAAQSSGLALQSSGLEGMYSGQGHYERIKISPRGPGSYLLHTCGYFGGLCAELKAVLTQEGPNTYKSTIGEITLVYGANNEVVCRYPISFTVVADGDQIFLSQYGPTSVPEDILYPGCPSRSELEYGDYISAEAYVKEAPAP